MQSALRRFEPKVRFVQVAEEMDRIAEKAGKGNNLARFIARQATGRLALLHRGAGATEARAQFLEREIELTRSSRIPGPDARITNQLAGDRPGPIPSLHEYESDGIRAP